MNKTSLAVVEVVEEEVFPATERPRPFSLRFAEKIGPRPVPKEGGPQIYDDPTTVSTTGQYEDVGTDET